MRFSEGGLDLAAILDLDLVDYAELVEGGTELAERLNRE